MQKASRTRDRLPAKKKASGWSFKPPSYDKIKERAESSGSRFDSWYKSGIDKFKPEQGDNTIRFLPGPVEGEHFGVNIWLHTRVGANNSDYLCLQKMKGKPCPICAEAVAARKANEPDEAKKFEPRLQILTWILDRDAEQARPILYPLSWTNDSIIASLSLNKKAHSVLAIANPDAGFDVSFQRKGEGLNTRYSAWVIDRDPSAISDDSKTYDEIAEFIEENPIPSILKYYDAKYLESILSGTQEERDEDLDEEENGDSTPRHAARRDEEEDDEDEDESKEEETEEDESDEEEDDEDEDEEDDASDDDADTEGEEEDDEDDDEEEERPKQRKASAKPTTKPRRRAGGSSGKIKQRR